MISASQGEKYTIFIPFYRISEDGMIRWRRVLKRVSSLFYVMLLFAVTLIAYNFKSTKMSDVSMNHVDNSDDIIDSSVLEEFRKNSAVSYESKDPVPLVAAVLVICSSRASAITNHLQQLTKYRPDPKAFPIVVSQDGNNKNVQLAIRTFVNKTVHIYSQQHQQKSAKNYVKIAQHYKWALDRVFFERNFPYVIVTEDDLDISPDFFSYFNATKPLLREDSSIWCVSAWNDNGRSKQVDKNRSDLLWRTDFFPGLGWMLSRDLWIELSPKFPQIYWDDWMRQPDIKKERSCIRPEISRTSHNMALAGKGSSGGLFKSYIGSILLPHTPVNFNLIDLSYLKKDNFDRQLKQQIKEAKTIAKDDLANVQLDPANAYKVTFSNAREWREIADSASVMYDIRSGMPRTAYAGVVPFLVRGARVFAISSKLNLHQLGQQKHEDVYDDIWDAQSRFQDFSKIYCKPSKWTGVCDPNNPKMMEWLKKRHVKLQNWGKMVVV